MIGAIIFGILGISCFIFSILQFCEKGVLLNNAYLYASKAERQRMNKKPYYIQSGIVFLMIGLIWITNAIEMLIDTGWLYEVVIVIAVAMIIYAVVSSIKIEKRKKRGS